MQHKGKIVKLPIVVASYVNKSTLNGRNWLRTLKLDWKSVFQVETSTKLDQLLQSHNEDSYEGINGEQAHIRIRPEAKPVYCKPRLVPYLLKNQVENEIRKLE